MPGEERQRKHTCNIYIYAVDKRLYQVQYTFTMKTNQVKMDAHVYLPARSNSYTGFLSPSFPGMFRHRSHEKVVASSLLSFQCQWTRVSSLYWIFSMKK